MLQLIDVRKNYKTAGEDVQALKGVSLRFRANEFVSILGPSGCGKTTLLNIIGGLDHYTEGDLIISGKSTKDYTDRDWDVYRNHRIGFVFQSYNLIPHQTVLGNVEIALTIAGISKAERKKRAEDALIKVGLGAELHKRPNQLSGGQMQRVAIARALVNNPEILLADEPTGALDTETSVQIMELIREIAGERLVIMVTHNPELAEQYSSRIVCLKDGLVVSDTNPYVVEEVLEDEAEEQTEALPMTKEEVKALKKAKKAEKKAAKKAAEKASMSLKTSLGLSARNLLMKKGRTAVTSIAGSIGIISVCLVLALSNGFNSYILKTEEDMLSHYPIQVTQTTMDMNAIMTNAATAPEMPDMSKLEDKVYVNSFLTNLASGMQVTNDISDEYIRHVESLSKEHYTAIQYGYGADLSFNLYTSVDVSEEGADDKIHWMSLEQIKEHYENEIRELDQSQETGYAQLAGYVDFLGSVYGKMPGTRIGDARYGEYVLSQYDIMEGGRFPQNKNEAVLVIGKNNESTDLTLAQLGFISQQDFVELFEKGESENNNPETDYKTVSYDEIYGKEYILYNNDDVYKKSTGDYAFEYVGDKGLMKDIDMSQEEGERVKITGILRLKEGLSYGCLSSGLYVTETLVEEYIQDNKTSEIVQAMDKPMQEINGFKIFQKPLTKNLEQYYISQTVGEIINSMPKGEYDKLDQSVKDMANNPIISKMKIYISVGDNYLLQGLNANDKVSSISIYTDTFESKEQVLAHLDNWNDIHKTEEEKQIRYTDTVGMMMSMMQTMLDAITYVLVAFTSISLVVSSVMIGIITYVSVVERVKEIGVLRSLGARKRDIKNLFNAETFIIGLTSGVLGVGITYLLSIGINALLGSLTGITTLASLPIGSAVTMVIISIALTLISGLIPARAAARKDPVVALRTE